ncbi:MAG: nucleotide exchange factor GrpE [Verrucomicrobiae bacterium]|nr:nucleotide exchange factor GrpE [Verrucomicrobiae bacterium]
MSKQEETESNETTETEEAVAVEVELTENEKADDGPATPEEIAALREKAAKADEHWERVLRQTAELDNFKKRAARDREEAVKYANERLIGQLLPVMDSFTMAIAATQSVEAVDVESLKVGVNMILTQFQGVLRDMGVEELDAAGKPFDPTWQEAMSQQETAEAEEGSVLQQLRKGYRLKGRLLRPASVIVAKAPAAKAESSAEEAVDKDTAE